MQEQSVHARPDEVLRAVPVRLIEVSAVCLIVKRGRTELRIGGERAAQAVHRVLSEASLGATAAQICQGFPELDRPAIAELIAKFRDRGFLVPASEDAAPTGQSESSRDIFYWHFGTEATRVTSALSKKPITIIGVNCVSRRLAAALAADGGVVADVVHYPLLCNLRLLDDRGELLEAEWPKESPRPRDYKDWFHTCDPQSLGCVVATSDFGGLHLMRQWNEFCFQHELHFLPVVLQDLIGYVGPLVVPGETACFECLRARQNSHFEDAESQRAAEPDSFESQRLAGFHPSMASILGDFAALELSRFYGGWAPPRVVGTLIEVNMLGPELTARHVLRVPRCRVCGPRSRPTQSTSLRNLFLPGNEWPK